MAIGWRIGGRTRLNPAKEEILCFQKGDGVIVIAPDQN